MDQWSYTDACVCPRCGERIEYAVVLDPAKFRANAPAGAIASKQRWNARESAKAAHTCSRGGDA